MGSKYQVHWMIGNRIVRKECSEYFIIALWYLLFESAYGNSSWKKLEIR